MVLGVSVDFGDAAMIPLSLSLFPDIDSLEGLIDETSTVLTVYVVTLAILLAVIVIGEVIAHRRRSPVEKLLRRRLG